MEIHAILCRTIPIGNRIQILEITDIFMHWQVELYQPALLPLLEAFGNTGHQNQPPQVFKRFLIALSSDKAVCALIPPTAQSKSLINRICECPDIYSNPSQYLRPLQIYVPCLFDLLSNVPPSPEIIMVLRALLDKAFQPFKHASPHLLPEPTPDDDFFPNMTKKCNRGTYVLDSKKPLSKDCLKDANRTQRHKSLSPGLFILNCPCGNHVYTTQIESIDMSMVMIDVHSAICITGVCCGFSVMRDHESPNVPFTIMRTRYAKGEIVR